MNIQYLFSEPHLISYFVCVSVNKKKQNKKEEEDIESFLLKRGYSNLCLF